MNANRTTCSACGLQFEATRRGARCPSCGTKMRGASGTLPPLPAGLQHHSTAVEPHHDYHFRVGLAAASVLFLLIGLFLVVTGIAGANGVMAGIGVLLVASAMGSAMVTGLWQKHDQQGVARLLAESPLILGVMMVAASVGFVLLVGLMIAWRFVGVATPLLVVAMVVVLVGFAYVTKMGHVWDLRMGHSIRSTLFHWSGPPSDKGGPV